MNIQMQQVAKTHYDFGRYVGLDRWASYWYQLREVLACAPERVLEIGKGDAVLGSYLLSHTEITYKTLDIAEDLKPDIVGSAENIPLPDGSFDLVCAFEILEHLPFEKFEKCLREIARVSKKHAIISLPHFGPAVKYLIKLPFLPEIKIARKIPYHPGHVFKGEHYWEIGKRGYSPRKIRKAVRKYFSITKEFVPFENQYHHFFVLEKK